MLPDWVPIWVRVVALLPPYVAFGWWVVVKVIAPMMREAGARDGGRGER